MMCSGGPKPTIGQSVLHPPYRSLVASLDIRLRSSSTPFIAEGYTAGHRVGAIVGSSDSCRRCRCRAAEGSASSPSRVLVLPVVCRSPARLSASQAVTATVVKALKETTNTKNKVVADEVKIDAIAANKTEIESMLAGNARP